MDSETVMGFNFFNLPCLAILHSLDRMDIPTLLKFNETKPIAKSFLKNMKPIKLVIKLGSDMSLLFIDDFRWFFYNSASDIGKELEQDQQVQKTVGPVTEMVTDEGNVWRSSVSSPTSKVLDLAEFLIGLFPKIVVDGLEVIHISLSDCIKRIQNLQKMDCPNVKCSVNSTSFNSVKSFHERWKKNNVVSIYHRNGKIALNMENKRVLPLRPELWFNRACLFAANVVFVSGVPVSDEHCRELLNFWMKCSNDRFAFIKIKNAVRLNLSKILKGFYTEKWDEKTMEKYKDLTHYSKYFQKKGVNITNNSGSLATVNYDAVNEEFYLLVWEKPEYKDIICNFPEIVEFRE